MCDKEDLASPMPDACVEQLEDLTAVATANLPNDESITYGSRGLRGIISTPYVFGAALLASLGGFSFGYDQGVISVINVMPQFHQVFPRTETAFGKGLMTGMMELGAFIGCLFMPTLADRISRKWALTVVVFIFNLGAILQTVAKSYDVLVAGRAIGGIGVGTLAMGAPIYISEIAPPNLRGCLLVLESVSVVTGVVISFYITYGTRHMASEASFRLPLGLQMVSSTLLGIGIHLFPYSPRWLALVGRSEDALQSLQRLRRLPASDPRVQTEHDAIVLQIQVQKKLQEKRHPGAGWLKLEALGWVELLRKKSWRRTVVAVGVAFFQQFSGINAFIYYAPTLFQSLGQTPEMALIMSGVFNVIQMVAVLACFFMIDKVGRRPLAIVGAVGGGVSWTIMAAISGVYSHDWLDNPAAGWAAVAMAFCFCLIYGVSYSPLGWALPAEVYPNALRARGVAMATATVWICNFIVGVATPPMMDGIGFGTYVFYGAWCYVAAVWAYFLVPETKEKTLEQLDELFQDDAGREERELMKAEVEAERARVKGQ